MSLYLSHFGLREPPFRITPHTDFFFAGANRGPTLEALIYAITQDEGIVKVTGEVGSGKTMLCRMLLEKLPADVETLYLANPSLSRQEILGAIADELGIPATGQSTHSLTRALQDALVARYAQGKRVVILIDEAHAMPAESLEEVRLLSNLESKSTKLLQIALFAQPELEERLAASDMRQLRERITQHFILDPLKPGDVAAYLEFRLRAAGYCGPNPFAERAVEQIAKTSKGLSRRINILADKAMLAAYSAGGHRIDRPEVQTAIRDARFSPLNTPGTPAGLAILGWIGLGVGVTALVGGLLFALWETTRQPTVATITQPGEGTANSAASAPSASPPNPGTLTPPPSTPQASVGETGRGESRFGPLTQRHLALYESWLPTAGQKHYFIQLFAINATNGAELEAFIRRAAPLLEGQQLRVYRSDRSGKDRLGAIYGEFDSREAALVAIDNLPEALRLLQPYPRQVSRLQ